MRKSVSCDALLSLAIKSSTLDPKCIGLIGLVDEDADIRNRPNEATKCLSKSIDNENGCLAGIGFFKGRTKWCSMPLPPEFQPDDPSPSIVFSPPLPPWLDGLRNWITEPLVNAVTSLRKNVPLRPS